MIKKIIKVIILLFVGILGLWAFYFEPDSLTVNRVKLKLPDWPEGLKVKIAVLSDYHIGMPYFREEKLHKITKIVNSLKPDLIVILGDFDAYTITRSNIDQNEIISAFSKLKAPYGTYAIIGNHYNNRPEKLHKDIFFTPIMGIFRNKLKPNLVRSLLNKANIEILEGINKEISINGKSFYLIGLAYKYLTKENIEIQISDIPEKAGKILLTHKPDRIKDVPSSVNLTLAGHTHGGQVNLPIIGVLMPHSEYGYTKGHFIDEGKHLFVTSGLGNQTLPVRFRVPPEIVLLEVE